MANKNLVLSNIETAISTNPVALQAVGKKLGMMEATVPLVMAVLKRQPLLVATAGIALVQALDMGVTFVDTIREWFSGDNDLGLSELFGAYLPAPDKSTDGEVKDFVSFLSSRQDEFRDLKTAEQICGGEVNFEALRRAVHMDQGVILVYRQLKTRRF